MTQTTATYAPLHRLELRGDSRARGLQHGRLLKDPIDRAIAFYQRFFAEHLRMDAVEMRKRARRFIEPTAAASPRLMREYEGIAEGAGQSLDDIFALSGRYEITFEHLRLGECSNVFVGPRRSADGHTLLGMNWEWRPEVMDFRAAIVARCEDMPDHIVVTECGQPGKYGINANGIAAIETGLGCSRNQSVGKNLFAVAIRHMLEQTTLDTACAALRAHPTEATINFFIADDSGYGMNIEMLPGEIAEKRLSPDEIDWHTNHSLLSNEPCTFADSLARGERWRALLRESQPVTWQTVGRWLADVTDSENPICKVANPALADSVTYLQTLCSIVLDPQARTLWVSDGPSCQNAYERIDFSYGNHDKRSAAAQ